MGTYRQKKVQTQDGVEMVQIKKLFKLDSLKAVHGVCVDTVPH